MAALIAKFDQRYPSALRNLVVVHLRVEFGLSCGEVVAIRPEHLDLAGCSLLVREGKGAKDRVVWCGDSLRDLIVCWPERRPVSEWLPCIRYATHVSTRHLRELVKRKARTAGIPEADRVTPHTLRHSFATRLLRKTKNIRLTQKALGHASLATTMIIYTHVGTKNWRRR